MKMEDRIAEGAALLLARLAEKGLKLSSAESCTGGLFAKSLVDRPGASAVFYGGVVSYVNEVKERVLGVSPDVIKAHTAVSAEVASAMAEGVRALCGTDVAVSVTGLAGPGGGTKEIPLGRVYLGYATAKGTTVEELNLPGSRDEVRGGAVLCMINGLLKLLR